MSRSTIAPTSSTQYEVVVAAHDLSGVERGSARERGQASEHGTLALVEEVVAPVDDGSQCLLARIDRPRT